MTDETIGQRIFGFMLVCTGAYMAGWGIAFAILLMITGHHMMVFPNRNRGPRKVVKDWIGNPHLED